MSLEKSNYVFRLADSHTRLAVQQIWKQVFGDSDEYIRLFFSDKYRDENTLIALSENQVVATLQMLPFDITFYGQKIPSYYLCGLATLPGHRGHGIMGNLIDASHRLMRERGIPLSTLIPAEKGLFSYYEKFGYTQTFREGPITGIPSLKDIWRGAANAHEAYRLFDEAYNRLDFCVQKNFSDFLTIVKDALVENFPTKKNLWGMSRLIEPLPLLARHAAAHPAQSFVIGVSDKLFGTTTIAVAQGTAAVTHSRPDFTIDVSQLAGLLFGFDTARCDAPFSDLFPPHETHMNHMLE